ncbi:MAG: tRNA-(ms[2]io[6]A)-hydroxylase [Phycisphaerales bacterium]|nr:tRNA-(ms[2]io[6]A)-hydroxylase [Phycisphaerales bacterium]
MTSRTAVDLPLRSQTPATWAAGVLREPLALLCDHAYLERKAATNALQLLNRWPEPDPPENWVVAMTSIAQDEVEHLAIVVRLLLKRGGSLSRNHRNEYASALHELVRLGRGPEELIDRLMISALIEARSCERFATLADNCADEELASLYGSLYASEAGHYRVFINLAKQLAASHIVDARWNEMLDAEARIIAAQPPGPTMHSGIPDAESQV